MLVWILRCGLMAIVIGVASWGLLHFQSDAKDITPFGVGVFVATISIGLTALAGDMLVRNKQITTISAVYFGLLLGLVLGALFSIALEPLLQSDDPQLKYLADLVQPMRLFVTSLCCYISISTLLQTKDEFRFIIPYVEFQKQLKGGRPL